MAVEPKAPAPTPARVVNFSSPSITFEQEELIDSFKQVLRAELNDFGSRYRLQPRRQMGVEVTPSDGDQAASHAWVGRNIRSYAAAAEGVNDMLARSSTRKWTQEGALFDVVPKATGPRAQQRKRLGSGASEGLRSVDVRAGSSNSVRPTSIQSRLKSPPPCESDAAKQAWSERRADRTPSRAISIVSDDSSMYEVNLMPASAAGSSLPLTPMVPVATSEQSQSLQKVAVRASNVHEVASEEIECMMRDGGVKTTETELSENAVRTISESPGFGHSSEDNVSETARKPGFILRMSTIQSLVPTVMTSHSDSSEQIITLQSLMVSAVSHLYFENLTVLFILANALTIGIQTDYSARHLTIDGPEAINFVNAIIAVFFGVELFMRLFAYRGFFFRMSSWRWNILDVVVVSLQMVEEIMSFMKLEESNMPSTLSLIRLVRILRLIRIIRIVRLLRYMSELRTIVVSMQGSMKPLFSTIVLLALVVYIVGVYFTQLALDYSIDHPGTPGADELQEYFGSVGTTVIALFQTVTGGLEWRNMLTPLMAHISPAMAIVFALYIVFTSLALMNIVTGVFVETALQRGREDKDVYMINHLKDLFGTLDGNQSGAISWNEVEANLDNPKLLAFFKDIDIDISEAKGLFNLLDRDGSGSIDAEDFLSGCLRLRGPAKALDMQLVMLELADHRRIVHGLLETWSKSE